MDTHEIILEVLKTIFILILGGFSLYLKYSPKAKTKAKEISDVIANITAHAVIFIEQAEDQYKDVTNAGGIKFELVVDKLYNLVPRSLRLIVTRKMIEDIVQKTFDEIEKYAKIQLDEAMDRLEVKG